MSRRWVLLAGGVLLALAVYLVWTPALRLAGQFLVEDQAPRPAGAIVVLSGSFPDRILEAVDLYADGFAKRIILCREPGNAGYEQLRARGVVMPRLYELNRSVAEQLGVPPEAITVIERSAGSTFSEARRVLEHVRDQGYDSILLVTSKYHTTRAASIYRHLAGGSIRITTRPARYDEFRPEAWWQDRKSLRRVLIEYQKLLLFMLHDRWQAAPITATEGTGAEAR